MGTTTTTVFGLVKPDGDEPRSNWPAQWGGSADTIDLEIDQAQDDIAANQTSLVAFRNNQASFAHSGAANQSVTVAEGRRVITGWTRKTGFPNAATSFISDEASGAFTVTQTGLFLITAKFITAASAATTAWSMLCHVVKGGSVASGIWTPGTFLSTDKVNHAGDANTNAETSWMVTFTVQITSGDVIRIVSDLTIHAGGTQSVPTGSDSLEKDFFIARIG